MIDITQVPIHKIFRQNMLAAICMRELDQITFSHYYELPPRLMPFQGRLSA